MAVGPPVSSGNHPPVTTRCDCPVKCDDPVPVAQVLRQTLLPSTSWEYPNETVLRFLRRQQQQTETTLNLESVIVQDERGLVALWTEER